MSTKLIETYASALRLSLEDMYTILDDEYSLGWSIETGCHINKEIKGKEDWILEAESSLLKRAEEDYANCKHEESKK